MTIATHHFSSFDDYLDARWNVVKQLENAIPLPYLDSEGLPTIGVGFFIISAS